MDKKLLITARRHLRKTDNVMFRLTKAGVLPVPSATGQPHYHALVRAIINQQLSVKAGRTIEKRLLTVQGGRYFKAEKTLGIKETVMRQCGISYNKIRYIRTLARAVTDGELNFRKLAKQDDDRVRDTLTQYPGIGQWSADMFLINSLQRPDVFPIDDLVLRKAVQRHYRISEQAKRDRYVALAEAWRPYRTIASYYLWTAS